MFHVSSWEGAAMSRHIDKAELISKLQTLEGLTNDERSSLIGLLRQHKKYGLVWEDKPEDVEERLREELSVLREVKDKAILSDDADAPNHILIEGDNLEALTALSYTHEGKIDVIYIDPPYNTGNKDFVYNDSFVDTEDSYRHSKWLSFMNKRLKIAKKLLSDKGVIFISIDDNEQANLKLLCDEVLGAKNCIGMEIWQKKKGGSNDSRHLATEHEYILFYAKSKEDLKEIYIPYEGEYLSRYKEIDEIGRFFWDTFKRKSGKQYYAITCPDGTVLEKEENGEPISWLRSEQRFLSDLQKGETRIIKINGKWTVHFKQRMPEGYKPRSIVVDKGTTSTGADEIKDIFNSNYVFSNPKPSSLVKYLIEFDNSKDSTILDFFAGSGTTLHATMQLNAEDGGHRQCILVTNNENNICEEVTYERNKRVINGYTTPKGVKVDGLQANTLRYYKTDYISRDRTQKNMRDLVAAATDLLCIKEDLYEEQKTFGRFKLKPQLARYFNNGNRHMLIIYREELIDEIAAEIKTLDFGKMRLKIYVFSPGRYAFNDNFREVEDKVELVALPAAIYDAYQKVLPKRREKLFEAEEKRETVAVSQDLFAYEEEGGEA